MYRQVHSQTPGVLCGSPKDFYDGFMSITLAALLSVPSLKLKKVGAAESTLSTPIQWVAVTEQENPQRFLSGGELVLTTGLRQKTAAAQRHFVRMVQRSGAVGIGFGTGLSSEVVPPALVAEANRWDIPVVEVPYETPFIALGKLVAEAQHADHLAKLERMLSGHQVLARSLLSGGGLPALLRQLAGLLRTDLRLRRYGREIFSTTAGSVGEPDSGHWLDVAISTGQRDATTLQVREPFRDAGILDYAKSLISLELNNQKHQRDASRKLAGQVMQDVIRGVLDPKDAGTRLSTIGVAAAKRQVVILVRPAPGNTPAQNKAIMSTPLPPELEGVPTAVVDSELLIITPEDKTAVDAAKAVHALLAEAGLKATIGIGGHYAKANGLRWSYFEARDAVARGLPVNEPERLSLTSLLLASEDVPLSDMAMETLKPLYDFDAAHGAGLLSTLESYLEHDGSVAAVAQALTLHRNTVRYRLAQITELSGYDPSTTADRVQLWLALAISRLGTR
ncbi:purine catabolism regulatory protein [Arthrobacter woluwensis]|uniref:Purine catabolism regulatory protein n=2 Tax=Arthrobacter woluwensis TaxID=156980 RepID=A0A1H4LNV7_9MICC|nr:purine catabolism regulatory protein [Arthrobacter woluwensis]